MSEFSEVLREMSRLPGVRGAMVATLEEGLVVDSELMIGVAGEPVAAFTSALLKRTRRSLGDGDLGRLDFVQVDAAEGFLFAVLPEGESELFLAVVADSRASPGIVRVEMKRRAEVLA